MIFGVFCQLAEWQKWQRVQPIVEEMRQKYAQAMAELVAVGVTGQDQTGLETGRAHDVFTLTLFVLPVTQRYAMIGQQEQNLFKQDLSKLKEGKRTCYPECCLCKTLS